MIYLAEFSPLHFRETLPAMRDTIQKQMLAMEPEVQQYKHYRPDDPAIKTKAMLQMIQALKVGEGTSVYL